MAATAISVLKNLLTQVQQELGVNKYKILSFYTEERQRHTQHYGKLKLYHAGGNEIAPYTIRDDSIETSIDIESQFYIIEFRLEFDDLLDKEITFREVSCDLPHEVTPVTGVVEDEDMDGETITQEFFSSEPPVGWKYSEEVQYLLLYNNKWEVHFPFVSRSLLK